MPATSLRRTVIRVKTKSLSRKVISPYKPARLKLSNNGLLSGALADKLPAVTIAAKNLATEMTNLNVETKDLFGEEPITSEHIQNNTSVRNMLGERGIRPEELPPEEDVKKVERRLKSEEKELANPKVKKTK